MISEQFVHSRTIITPDHYFCFALFVCLIIKLHTVCTCMYKYIPRTEVIFAGTVLPENIYSVMEVFAMAISQIYTEFLPRQRPGMPKFY